MLTSVHSLSQGLHILHVSKPYDMAFGILQLISDVAKIPMNNKRLLITRCQVGRKTILTTDNM